MLPIKTAYGDTFKINDIDSTLISKYVWSIDEFGFLYRLVPAKTGTARVFIFQDILNNIDSNTIPIYLDGDSLNNTQPNLTSQQLQPNTNSKSGFSGISQHGEKWRAKITHDNNTYHIGNFDLKFQAILAYDFWVRRLGMPDDKLNLKTHTIQTISLHKVLGEDGTYSSRLIQPEDVHFRGIKFLKDKSLYGAFITHHGKTIKIGTSKDPAYAALMYDTATTILSGKFASTNFTGKEPITRIVDKITAL